MGVGWVERLIVFVVCRVFAELTLQGVGGIIVKTWSVDDVKWCDDAVRRECFPVVNRDYSTQRQDGPRGPGPKREM